MPIYFKREPAVGVDSRPLITSFLRKISLDADGASSFFFFDRLESLLELEFFSILGLGLIGQALFLIDVFKYVDVYNTIYDMTAITLSKLK